MQAPDQEAGSFLATYLKPLTAALTDPYVVEIAINPDGQVWVETQGAAHMQRVGDITFSHAQARDLASAIAGATQGQISEKKPLISGKILYASKPIRAQVVYTPVIESGPSIVSAAPTPPSASVRDQRFSPCSVFGWEVLHGALSGGSQSD